MSGDFLPPDYQKPPSPGEGKYMKFVEGKNRFRFLTAPITGWEGWKNDKPMRFRTRDDIPDGIIWDIDKKSGKQKIPKFFWAAMVWNYAPKEVTDSRGVKSVVQSGIQVLEISQITIYNEIEKIVKDPDYGNPKGTEGYDIKVERTQDGGKTEYSTLPGKNTPLDPAIVAAFDMLDYELEALYEGDDPFLNKMPPEVGIPA